jgi:type IV secretory pathway protease TraF
MLNSKRTLLVLLALVLTVLAMTASFVPDASACYPAGVYRYYNSTYTVQVGTMTVTCACKITVTGTKTGYVRFSPYTCGIEQ